MIFRSTKSRIYREMANEIFLRSSKINVLQIGENLRFRCSYFIGKRPAGSNQILPKREIVANKRNSKNVSQYLHN
jgi:hypothetical protein